MRTILALAAVSICASGARAATHDVYVFNFDFSVEHPSTGIIQDAVINAGDTVRWIWVAGLHSVTSFPDSAEVFDSGLLTPPSDFSYTFNNVGEFNYLCSIHSEQHMGHITGMVGSVTVLVPATAGGAVEALGLIAGRRRRR